MSSRIYNPLIVLLVFAVAAVLQLGSRQQVSVGGRHPAVERYTFPSVGKRLDAPVHDVFFSLRNNFFEQPISEEVTVVGIDDYTERKYGKFGTGTWTTRDPFRAKLRYCANVFYPSVIAYDIMFRKVKGEKQEREDNLVASDPETIKRIQEALAELEETEEIRDNELLYAMARISYELGDYNLASALGEAFTPDAEMDKRITTILAYQVPEVNTDKWSQEAILGDDPEDLAEDWGLEMPYLRDIRIPNEFVTNTDDYPWYDYSLQMPTNMYLDYGRLGYINVPRDEDGIVRRIPLVLGMRYSFEDPETKETVTRQFFLPSLSLLSCLSHWGINLTGLHMDETFVVDGEPVVSVEMGKAVRVRKPNGELVEIPIDDHGRLILDFVGQIRDFNNLSFAAMMDYPPAAYDKSLAAEIPPEVAAVIEKESDRIQAIFDRIHRKLVIVGVTATGQSDVGPCPINTNTPFVHMHMTAASNILTGTYITHTRPLFEAVILGSICAIMMLGAAFLRPLRLSYLSIGVMLAYGIGAFFGVVQHWRQMPVIVPMGAIAVSFLGLLLVHYLTEAREKLRIRGMFSTMVSGEVLNYMETHPGSFSLGGERRDATIFFSDLAGFTTISENLPADKLVDLLNEYLSPMTEIIMETQGFVDKYIGDAIMAVWGVPYPNPDHARLACWAALDQQAKIDALGARFKEEYGVDVLVRMGINSGTIVAGNMGSSARLSYTVMGDAVNQAARYEPANKDYGTLIMIGESTFQEAREHIEARLLDRVVVKGKSVPIQVYELLAKRGELSEDKDKVRSLYHQALEVHWARNWDKALELLDDALVIDPDDGPSQAMRERIEGYRETPPPDGWQGEFVRTKK